MMKHVVQLKPSTSPSLCSREIPAYCAEPLRADSKLEAKFERLFINNYVIAELLLITFQLHVLGGFNAGLRM